MLTRPITRGITRPITRPLVRQSSVFDPLTLWAQGQQGAWYDPSDLTTLFQDSAGTTPVTADGDPVGLMLDKSRGAKSGAEIQPNSTFDTDLSGWTTSYWQWSSGAAYHPPGGDFNTLLSVDISAYRGKWVYLEFTAQVELGSLRCQYRTSDDSPTSTGPDSYPRGSQNGFTSGTYKLLSKVPDNATYIGFARDVPGQITEIRLESASIRELPGNHASQSTTAAKPTYRTDGTLHWLEGDGVDDFISCSLGTEIVQPNTVCIAAKWAYGGESPILLGRLGPSGSGQLIFSLAAGSSWRMYAGNVYATSLIPSTSRPDIISAFYNASNSIFRQNGVAVSANPGANAMDSIALFAESGGSLAGRSDIYGVVIVEGEVPDYPKLEEYLAAKAGVTLP